MIVAFVIVWLVACGWWFVHHQRKLKQRAYLMQEAMRNRDFSFRLPTSGLLFGERAMQEALNNVGQELKKQIAENEVESWQKLTRVLTHEIMNATAPIASISQTFLSRDDVKGTPIEEGIRAIHDTSIGLNSFVENYRVFTQLQTPEPTHVNLCSLANSVKQLYPTLTWSIDIDEQAEVVTDKGLLRQVLINLTKNAIEAGAANIQVALQHTDLLVSNDGPPILPDVRREIFTPFFTTKSTGSGIGLSLSRKIMVMQGGDLQLADKPVPGYHATFLISVI